MPESEKEVTSIRVNPELWKKAKIEAINRDVPLADLVEVALAKELGVEKEFGAKSKLKGGKL